MTKIAIMWLCLGFPLWASNYYFDATAGKDANPGTAVSPFQTLAKVAGLKLLPGDSLLLRRGADWAVDSLFLTAVGTESLPVVMSAYGDPLLGRPHIAAPGRLLVLRKSKNVILENLELSGARGGCIEMWDSTNSNIVVQRIEAHHCGGGVYVTGTNITVRDNFIHDGHMVVNTDGRVNTAVNNDDYGASGINMGTVDGCKVYNNRLVDLIAPSFDYGTDGGAFEFWKTARHCEIYNNFAFHVDGFVEFGGQVKDSVIDVSFHHNIALEAKVLACFHGGAGFGVGYDKLRMDNNLLINRRTNPYSFFFGSDGPKLDRADRIQVRNNILVSDSATYYSYDDGSWKNPNFGHPNNLIWTPGFNTFNSGWTPGLGEIYGNPWFASNWDSAKAIDTLPGSYRLLARSPAVGTGLNLGYAKDYFGNPASRGEVTDMGPIATQSPTSVLPSVAGFQARPVVARLVGKQLQLGLQLDQAAPLLARLLAIDGSVLATTSWMAPAGGSTHWLDVSAGEGVQFLSLQTQGQAAFTLPLPAAVVR